MRHLSHQFGLAFAGLLVMLGAPRVHLTRTVFEPVASAASAPSASASASSSANIAPCPPGEIDDNHVCIALPVANEDMLGAPDIAARLTGHHEKSGLWKSYEQIPRRPDRPADYDAYVYPIPPGMPDGHSVVSGYDLDQPDDRQRRGGMRAVGHGAVDLPQKKGTPIKMITLEHQVGDAKILFLGPLMGQSIVTVHTIREGGKLRQYVMIFGHVDGWPADIKQGMTIAAGDTIGFVGDTGSPELVHLHLELRRVRDGIEGTKIPPSKIVAEDTTIVCDPRNLLPLRSGVREK